MTQVVLSLKSSIASLQQQNNFKPHHKEIINDKSARTDKFCKFCRKAGHDINNCFRRQNPATCYQCGKRGHLARNCSGTRQRVTQIQESDVSSTEQTSSDVDECQFSASQHDNVCQLTVDNDNNWTVVKRKRKKTSTKRVGAPVILLSRYNSRL